MTPQWSHLNPGMPGDLLQGNEPALVRLIMSPEDFSIHTRFAGAILTDSPAMEPVPIALPQVRHWSGPDGKGLGEASAIEVPEA
jgi:hypothetical protein